MCSVRLPRFNRSENISRFRLTERDLKILKHVSSHRFLRSGHLCALLPGSKQQILRRLQLLYHHGFLERPRCQIDYYQNGSRPMVYGIGNKGAAVLKRELGFPYHRLEWGQKSRVGRIFLDHALLISDVMVAFEVACRNQAGVKLIRPDDAAIPIAAARQREPFQWKVNVASGIKCGVIPDRVFGLEITDKSGRQILSWFFLEADRGTMPVTRDGLDQSSFYRKLLAYEATWRQGLHRSLFDFDRFRVLTVTTAAERRQHMVEACAQLEQGHGLFLFADFASLSSAENVLTLPWLSGRANKETLL